ncbi:RNA polymerase sigma factor [Aureliella helgolandensis]|uniref:ECF RNA polymerase sigma factor RpoE n=1 Tax=Aureliella helgolandensis TaxID=2527968 RepID=A0A518G0Q0_9BACT|nr:sigma-70 family RNA polymerase sigma factor [Aureliella helgolandensis]QDV22182.1 ECF RNA polymerase sigma factor RpoE [Aureliella helgolandensis]
MVLPDTRVTLLQRLHDGRDSSAWTEFCAIYERAIYSIARRHGLQDADAREVSQEVLLTLSRRIHRFDPQLDGRFRAWLSVIAHNATIDLLRKNRKHQAKNGVSPSKLEASNRAEAGEGDAQPPDLSPRQGPAPLNRNEQSRIFDQEARREQFLWAAEQTRRGISETTWLAFWQTTIEEQSCEQVASQLGITVGAVYVARCRTLAKIKQLVEPFRESGE